MVKLTTIFVDVCLTNRYQSNWLSVQPINNHSILENINNNRLHRITPIIGYNQ